MTRTTSLGLKVHFLVIKARRHHLGILGGTKKDPVVTVADKVTLPHTPQSQPTHGGRRKLAVEPERGLRGEAQRGRL